MNEKGRQKKRRTYHFLVDGQCEEWYLHWLEKQVNAESNSKFSVKFAVESNCSAKSFVRRVPMQCKIKAVRVIDIESGALNHIVGFNNSLDELKKAEKDSCGGVHFKLAYSNQSFEVWMLLHRRPTVPPASGVQIF